MRILSGWKRTKGEPVGNGMFFIEITNESGESWYDIMEGLDDRPERYAVGVNPDNRVSWVTEGKLSGVYAPADGGIIVLCNTFNIEDARNVVFDGHEFVPIPVEEPVVRTKEDIMADLIKLQEELKAL